MVVRSQSRCRENRVALMGENDGVSGGAAVIERNVRLDFACNNPDNGDFAGRVSAIHLPEGALELTSRNWAITSFRGCPKFDEVGSAIRFLRRLWRFAGTVNWAGNWCWNAYWFPLNDAAELLFQARASGLFRCEGGWCSVCEPWERGDSPAIRAAIRDLSGEASRLR